MRKAREKKALKKTQEVEQNVEEIKEPVEKYPIHKDRGIIPITCCPHCGSTSYSYWNSSVGAYTAYCSNLDGCGAMLGPCNSREEATARWEKRFKLPKV